jgi:hypothetical protein
MSDDTAFEQGSGSPTTTPLPADPTDTSTGKHAILLVPNFGNVPGVGPEPMNTYVRLGASHSEAGNPNRVDLGEDLASMVWGFTDDTATLRGGAGGQGTANPGDVCPPENFSSPPGTPSGFEVLAGENNSLGRAESRVLHSKGGWRDHSDGNRITTTRGDKVEVIRGNYKMLVLGRSDGFANAAGIEIAGGNVDTNSDDLAYGSAPDGTVPAGSLPGTSAPLDATRTIALQTSFEWHEDSDGRWGWTQTIKTGHESQPSGSGGNGRIITQTWVDYQETDLGSATTPVNEILSTTYANTMTGTTNVTGSLTQWTNAHSIRNGTIARMSIDNTTSSPTINNATSAAAINNATASALQLNTQAIAANLNLNLFGAGLELDAAGVLAQLIVAGAQATMWVVPIVNDDHLFIHNDMHPGVHVDHHSGMHMDLHDGEHATFDLNGVIKISNGALVRLHEDLDLTLVAGNHFTTSTSTFCAAQTLAATMASQFMVVP